MEALPLCRAPFPNFWLEWPGGLGLDDEPGSFDRSGLEVPLRFGVLVKSINDDGTELGLTYAWAFRSGLVNVCPVGCVLHLDRDTGQASSASQALSSKTEVGVVGFALEFIKAANQTLGADAVRRLTTGWVKDTSGELPYVIAALCLLSAKGGVSIEPVDHGALNAARRKRGKLPLLSHSKVTISISREERERAMAAGVTGEALRQHIVRGHFKVRKTGVYWWRPFVRGNAEAGAVVRSGYQVAA